MKSILVALLFLALGSIAQADKESEVIKVRYTYWGSNDVSEKIIVKVIKNSNFYNVMEEAAAKDNKFRFESTYHSQYGHFITSIGGMDQQPADNKYWMIYILSSKPDMDNPPADELLSPVGVDSLMVDEESFYLFWLKTVSNNHA